MVVGIMAVMVVVARPHFRYVCRYIYICIYIYVYIYIERERERERKKNKRTYVYEWIITFLVNSVHA